MEFLDLINRDTGPAGTGIQILGTYENEEKLVCNRGSHDYEQCDDFCIMQQ